MEGKVIYNADDIFHSETWDIQAYITYTDKREKKHEKVQKGLQEAIKYCSMTKCSFAELVNNFINDTEMLSVIFNNAYALSQYIKCVK